jgi:hypothetical protein
MKAENSDSGLNEVALAPLAGMAAESAEARRVAGASINEIAAGWLAPQYLLALRGQLMECGVGPERFKLLRQAANDLVTFQRGGFWSARLDLEREKLEFQRQKHKDRLEADKLAVAKKRDLNQPMTDEELKACVDKVDEIMGLK